LPSKGRSRGSKCSTLPTLSLWALRQGKSDGSRRDPGLEHPRQAPRAMARTRRSRGSAVRRERAVSAVRTTLDDVFSGWSARGSLRGPSLVLRALIRANPSQGNARIQVFARSGCRRKGGRRDAPGRLVRRRCTCGADCRRRDFTMPNRYRTLGHRFAVANAPQRRSAWQARESDARDGVPAAARSPARTSTPTSTREPLGPSGLRRRTRHVVAYDSHHFRKRQSPRRTQPAASGSTHADPVRFAFFRARRAFGAG
jgi:hypothetical protein